MRRPDFSRAERQQREIGGFVGETAVWRQYVTAQAGTPSYGRGNSPQYAERTITGLFNPVSFDEIAAAGGQYLAGDMKATLIDCKPGTRDEVIWSGTVYRVESEVIPQALFNRNGWRMILRRGG